MSDEDDDIFNEGDETLLVLSEEEDLAETTVQSSDSMFFPWSSGSNLFIPSVRNQAKQIRSKRGTPKKAQRPKSGPAHSTKVVFKCHVCNRSLKTEKGPKKHRLNRKLREAASRKPSPDQFAKRCVEEACKVALDIKSAPTSTILSGTKSTDFADSIFQSTIPEPTKEFSNFVLVWVEDLAKRLYATETVLLPWFVNETVRFKIHTQLAEENVRLERLSKLQEVSKGEHLGEGIAEGYLQEFCRRLALKTAAYLLCFMRDAPDDNHVISSKKYCDDDYDKLFSQQSLHNVLGCTVKAVLRRSRQYSTSKRWMDIQRVVLNRFASVRVMEAEPTQTSFWTALLGRKSYTFVSEDVLKFFIEIAKMLCYIETSSGSIPIKEVLKQVVSSPALMCHWHSVDGGGLGEEDSMFLLRLLVTGLCKTFGRGVLLRRTNQEAPRLQKSTGGVSSVSKRAQLAR